MEHIHIFEVIPQISSFIGAENAQRQAEQGPQVDGLPWMVADFAQIMNLGMAVVTRGNAVVGTGGQDLVGLQCCRIFGVLPDSRIGEATAAAAAVIIGAVGVHVDIVLFSDNGL